MLLLAFVHQLEGIKQEVVLNVFFQQQLRESSVIVKVEGEVE